ncbi:MAG TPA: hypothetical protein VEX86_20265 [Longimicrobium sp.]|nr:hypothetical protein [Longimicrobium sp.]
MPLDVSLKLSGESETFVKEIMAQEHLTSHEVVARALWLLRKVYKSPGRVALLKHDAAPSVISDVVERIYTIRESDTEGPGVADDRRAAPSAGVIDTRNVDLAPADSSQGSGAPAAVGSPTTAFEAEETVRV